MSEPSSNQLQSVNVRDLDQKVEGLAQTIEALIETLKFHKTLPDGYLAYQLQERVRSLSQPYEGKVEKPDTISMLERMHRAAVVAPEAPTA